MATGSHDFSQAAQVMVKKGDFASLRDYLGKLDVPTEEIAALEGAVGDDAKDVGDGKVGARVSNWIGRMIGKAADGTLKIGTSVASTVITKALMKYYGLE